MAQYAVLRNGRELGTGTTLAEAIEEAQSTHRSATLADLRDEAITGNSWVGKFHQGLLARVRAGEADAVLEGLHGKWSCLQWSFASDCFSSESGYDSADDLAQTIAHQALLHWLPLVVFHEHAAINADAFGDLLR